MLLIILEALGSVSMKPKDFQELIRLLQPQVDGAEVQYSTAIATCKSDD